MRTPDSRVLVIFSVLAVPLAARADDASARAAAAAKACDGGSSNDCVQLATLYGNGAGVPRDIARAYALYEKACAMNNAAGCMRAGNGEGSLVDLRKQACDAGNAVGCYELGVLYDRGLGVAKDSSRGAALFKKACDGGDADGCARSGAATNGVVIGKNVEIGTSPEKDVPREKEKSLAVLTKACNEGDTIECLRLGTYYAAGAGVKRDFTRANAFYKQACDGTDRVDASLGCYAEGLEYERGLGVPKDAAKAAALYQKACDAGKDDESGMQMNGEPCFRLGLMYERGSGVSRDAARAAALFRGACDGGSKDACARVKR